MDLVQKLKITKDHLSNLSLKRLGYDCFNTDNQTVQDILMVYSKTSLPKSFQDMVEALEAARRQEKDGKVEGLAALPNSFEFERTVKMLVPFRPTSDMPIFNGGGRGEFHCDFLFFVFISTLFCDGTFIKLFLCCRVAQRSAGAVQAEEHRIVAGGAGLG